MVGMKCMLARRKMCLSDLKLSVEWVPAANAIDLRCTGEIRVLKMCGETAVRL